VNYEKLVTARKTYSCTYCGRSIEKKDKYIKISITPWCHYLNEGFETWRVHEGCKVAGDKFYYDDLEYGIFPNLYYGKEEFINYLG